MANLLFLFLNPRVNKGKARLVFTTHNAEILDLFHRNDAIFVLQNGDGGIRAKNMSEYGYRRGVSHSRLINANAFGTMPNYERLMALQDDIVAYWNGE